MIYRLRRKFMLVSAVSMLAVFALIYTGLCFINIYQLDYNMDTMADIISANEIIRDDDDITLPDESWGDIDTADDNVPQEDFRTPENQLDASFFIVLTDEEYNIISADMIMEFSITSQQAEQYAGYALGSSSERGWVGDYRYKVSSEDYGFSIVFINGSVNRSVTYGTLITFFFVLFGSGLCIIVLIAIFSKKVMRPAVESYEKQKQFITDANHELKTPLTLILSNLDIVETELGKNEWLDDIKEEGERMNLLINRLVSLSRMDEGASKLSIGQFDLSVTAGEAVSEFLQLAAERQKTLITDIEQSVKYTGDEALIRRLIIILLDNAVKYCDEDGEIRFSLRGRRHPTITVENTYAEVGNTALDKLFDRFYREDKARTFSGSFGIGLSIAKEITNQHHGEISAYKKDDTHIGFRVVLRSQRARN